MANSWFDYDKRLRSQHFDGKARDLTITRVGEVKAEFEQNEMTPVIYFKETPKYLELNETNRMKIVELFGDEKSNCVGGRIRLAVKNVRGGKIGIVITGKAPAPGAKPAPTQATAPVDTTAPKPGNETTDVKPAQPEHVDAWADLTGAIAPETTPPADPASERPTLRQAIAASYDRDGKLNELRAERASARKLKLTVPELDQNWLATATPTMIDEELAATRTIVKAARRERLMETP